MTDDCIAYYETVWRNTPAQREVKRCRTHQCLIIDYICDSQRKQK